MKEDVFNTSIRKLLKEFGVTAQREIERIGASCAFSEDRFPALTARSLGRS